MTTKPRADGTAEEWQEKLGLDATPDTELVALLEKYRDDDAVHSDSLATRTPSAGDVWTPDQIVRSLLTAVLSESVPVSLGQARRRTGQSLADVAEKVGVTRGRIHQLEQPDANLTLDTVAKVADALGYDVQITLTPRDPHDSPFTTKL